MAVRGVKRLRGRGRPVERDSKGECGDYEMNAKDLARAVADQHGMSQSDAQTMITAVLDAVVETVAAGEEVSLPGFGKFKAKDVAAREGRNPSTGETMTFAAQRKITFQPAKAVKERLQE